MDLGQSDVRETTEEKYEKKGLTKAQLHKYYTEWFDADHRLRRKLNRKPEDNEIRAELDVSEEIYAAIYEFVHGLDDGTFDIPGIENSY